MNSHPDFLKAIALHREGKKADAELLLRALRQAEPGNVEFVVQHGVLLSEMGQMEECAAAMLYAVGIQPLNSLCWHLLSFAFGMMGQPHRAIDAAERCLRLAPDNPTARWNLAQNQLLLGNYEDGWENYEWGVAAKQRPVRTRQDPAKKLPIGGRFLLWPEQGLGDTLMMLRFLPELHRRTKTDIFLEMPAELYPIVSRNFPNVTVYCSPGDESLPYEVDAHCSLMSLPYLLQIDTPKEAASAPYLTADPLRVKRWESELPDLLNVGICMKGRPTHPNDRMRSTTPDLWKEVLETKGVSWTILDPELNANLTDFEETAALISVLDLVITVDTAVAHLAGAMGKTAWVLLPFNADYRWGREMDCTPWYDSLELFRCATLDRQTPANSWGPVFETVSDRLKTLANTRAGGKKCPKGIPLKTT